MSFSVSQFKTLCEKYSTWAEMKAYLEGEKLRVVEEDGIAVIRYEKGQEVSEECGVWRSVVWDTAKNLPVCVAPARAKEGMPPVGVKLSATEDFVDGFMVNAWLSGGDVRVATRTKVGGENTYYSEKTFRELFEEAVAASPLKTMDAVRAALAGPAERAAGHRPGVDRAVAAVAGDGGLPGVEARCAAVDALVFGVLQAVLEEDV
jgi:hypothetical protein